MAPISSCSQRFLIILCILARIDKSPKEYMQFLVVNNFMH